MANLIQSTTLLPASATYSSGPLRFTQGVRIVGSAYADKNGTLYIEQSGDGTDFDISQQISVTGNTGASLDEPLGTSFDEPLLLPYIQVRFTNTSSSAQTVFRLYGNVQAADGYFVSGAQVVGISDSTYLTLQWNGSKYLPVGTFNATDGSDANSQAAIELAQNGKFASFPISSSTVDNVTLSRQANPNPATF